ncbi:4-hydroxyproline epimerase [Pseudoduganella chitinolytica]|uniref:4-hydroxyproline epimerase n=1 Tax=Pseudoduganella chitinolytica TaxID=34070 RepID=A0ABY8BGH2_9BURK|nr:4-hydroxyproline epimerase [Pseudoduganella chitinolytica]WEF35025.1 4-hydroxyproline epimerase [Pseudoduganella chitinolytica]
MQRLDIIDSHTGGEPTRLIVAGGPDLGTGPLAERLARMRTGHDRYRTATVCEPRGSDVLVGALLCAPHAPDCVAGVLFFNNVGYLGMCGHGTIGLVASLAHLGRIGPGRHRIDTPVGVVTAELHEDGSVTVDNVPAHRTRQAVQVAVPGYGSVTGDVAWGGNWFFLVGAHPFAVVPAEIEALTAYCVAVGDALAAAGIAGDDGAPIDHIEVFGAPTDPAVADSRSFVLCPGKAYDRSPCGTGTSAKLACLAADGKLAPGRTWRQQSIIGSVFEACYRVEEGNVLPSIRGRAWINAEAALLVDDTDPFGWGIPR